MAWTGRPCWRHVILMLAGLAGVICRAEYDPFSRSKNNPVLDQIAFHDPALHAVIQTGYQACRCIRSPMRHA